jgi:hypothetical protein
MPFATRSRRAARGAGGVSAFTVVPFDARGAGVGEVPPQIAIETPDEETLLILCAEPDRPDEHGPQRMQIALEAFAAGFSSAGPRSLTTALLGGVREANAALYDPRVAQPGHHAIGIGLTALAIRGNDGYILQAGPGQALVLQGGETIALPPLSAHVSARGFMHPESEIAALGVLSALDPDLFHIDIRPEMHIAIVASALGRVLAHEDDRPLHVPSVASVAETLVGLARHYRLPDAYGAVVVAGDGGTNGYEPPELPRWNSDSRGLHLAAQQPHYRGWSGDLPTTDAPPPPLPPRGWGLNESPAPMEASPWDQYDPPAYDPAGHEEIYTLRPPGQRAAWQGRRGVGAYRLPALPPRLWMLLGAIALTVVLALLIGVVHTISGHRADSQTRHALDAAAAARVQALAQHDPQAAYTALLAIGTQLDQVAATGREPQRVAIERQQLAQALDTVTGVSRVTPRVVGTLAHYEGGPGLHRLIMRGEDGKLYLYERDAKGDWGVFLFNPDAVKLDRLFSTGSVANKVPASDIRGLTWVNGPATTDRTRLFVRGGTGVWQETTLSGIADKRPTALAALGDALYLLDTNAGQIIRVPLKDGTATPWTNAAASPELRTAIDMTADSQTLWVLLADGRVRGYIGGTAAQSITLASTPALKDLTALATVPRSPYLYVAENGSGRILRVRKTDGRVVQVLRAADGTPPLVAIQSMTIDEDGGTLWAVTADGIITVPLPPVTGG